MKPAAEVGRVLDLARLPPESCPTTAGQIPHKAIRAKESPRLQARRHVRTGPVSRATARVPHTWQGPIPRYDRTSRRAAVSAGRHSPGRRPVGHDPQGNGPPGKGAWSPGCRQAGRQREHRANAPRFHGPTSPRASAMIPRASASWPTAQASGRRPAVPRVGTPGRRPVAQSSD